MQVFHTHVAAILFSHPPDLPTLRECLSEQTAPEINPAQHYGQEPQRTSL